MPDAVETLRSLAEKARRKDLPRRHELVAAALEVGADALETTRTFVNKKGDAIEYDAPQHAAAISAVKVAADLALKFEAKPHEAEAGSMDEFVGQVTASGMAPVLMTKLAEAMASKKGASA